MSQATEESTLFERIGGMNAVNAATELFYKKVTQDDRINHFFESVNISAQSAKMKSFLAYALGAPLNYTDRSMRDAHAHMHLTEKHFTAVSEHLVATLEELSVPQPLIKEVIDIVASTKADVLYL